MGLFKNKVGRPSNEIKYIRKVFVISVIAIVLSVVSLIISCLLLNGSIGNKILGKAKSDDITIIMKPDSNEQYTVVWERLFTIDYYNFKETDKRNVNITISNKNDNDSVWYGWFTYNKSVNKNNMTWGGTDNERKCAEIESNGKFKGTKTMKLDSSGDGAVRIGRIKVYESEADCKADDNGIATSLKELIIEYRYDSSSSSTTDADTEKAISLLEWIINFFKSLFSEKDDKPSTGDSEQTTKEIALYCPSKAKVNTEFTCSTDMAGVTISLSSDGLTGVQPSWTTVANDFIKPVKYDRTGTITVTATKSGYTTKNVNVKIVSGNVTGTYISIISNVNYTKVFDNSGNYRDGNKQEGGSSCNCYAKNFAERIVNGTSSTLVTGCGYEVYSDGNECQKSEAEAFKKIREQIVDGKPVVAYVTTSQGHWITIIGIKTTSITKAEADLTYSDFLVADPLKSGENNWDSLGRKLRKSDNNNICPGEYRLGF